MYSVLVVDNDATCLATTKSSLNSWNYLVATAYHPAQALRLLKEVSFHLVLVDVHFPEINIGLQLLRCIKKEHDIPVIVMLEAAMLADVQSQVIGEALENGAQAFLLKPVMVDSLRDIWKFCEPKKVNQSENPITGSYPVPANISETENFDDEPNYKISKFSWTPMLHTRFVEVLLIIGYHKAIPKTILEVMNAPGVVTREQVGSHLQKYRMFLNRVLDGEMPFESSKYFTHYSYRYSSIVGCNANLLLINQLREERRTGIPAAPISAPLPLPPFNGTAGSSSRCIFSTKTNYASSSKNINTGGIGGGSATLNNPIQNLNYKANQTSYSTQNTPLVPRRNYNFTTLRSVGGANLNNWVLSTNLIGPSNNPTKSFQNDFISDQSLNLVGNGGTSIFNVNKFNGAHLGNLVPDHYSGGSFAENQFANDLRKHHYKKRG